jgi:transposase-like protein
MEKEAIKTYFKSLSIIERQTLISELEQLDSAISVVPKCQEIRRNILNNKQGECPHCGHKKYVRFGKDKGSQRYKCKSCKRSFTEYTGTWMAGIHKKDKIDDYIGLMLEEKSLDKIKSALKINKKTAFDWRHKILSSLSETDKGDFTGITESDETFFLHSEKGQKIQGRKPKKRGGTSGKSGANDEQIAVIVTQDRKKEMDLTVATKGRLKKIDLEYAIGDRLSNQAILCSDSHVSYKGFAKDKKIEHHPLRTDLREHVKNSVYHIQHVNSTHNRLKKWIDDRFWGVSTKYLQQYLYWFRMKEILKNSKQMIRSFAERSVEDTKASWRHKQIVVRYKMILSSPN